MKREPNDYSEQEWADLHAPIHDERDGDADRERSKEYDGGLLDDCLSIVELGEQLKAKMAEPAGENIFEAAKRRDAEERAGRNKSVYSQMARIFGDACAKHIMPEVEK